MNLLSFLTSFAHISPDHGMVLFGGQLSTIGAGLGILALVTYFKRWKWLWNEWLTSLDPKKIGVMYLVVAGAMLLKAGVEAGLMRAQQALSAGDSTGIVSSDHFQQMFTAHGTVMIFFVAMGIIFGLINLVLPLIIGARDVAFPFMNSTSFWLFAAGVGLANVSLLWGDFSTAGWLAYPPLSELAYSPGTGVDYWIWSLQIAGVGSMLSGINFFVTIIKMRAKGMTLMKMPLFAWATLGAMALVMFAFPILTATLAMLALDRSLGMHFFTADGGGNAMMYVNLIWAWGHPEVYILVLPAFGVFSEIVATFSRKRLFGYASMVWAIIAITILSFLVWLHHFFTMGAGANVNAFFGIMTMIIAVPTGVKVFNWLFTMYKGRVQFTTPMLWFLGFVITFSIGGVTGVLMAVPAIDFQVHNSLFLVAHFHNMIIGGVVFGFFAALTYWWPKIFGFKLNEKLGLYAFWCWLVGFLLAFMPLYVLGIMGATRRLDHYDASMGWQWLFGVAAVGVVVIGAGLVLQILQIAVSVWRRKQNLDTTGDPWNGRTLEWSVPSPAPLYNFAIEPVVEDHDPFWDAKHSGQPKPKPHYTDIHMPKNTSAGIFIAGFAFLFGYGVIWRILPVVIVGGVGILVSIIVRLNQDEVEYTIPAAEIRKAEEARAGVAQ